MRENIRLLESAGKREAAQILRDLVEAVPNAIHTVLTDNGIQFTNRARDICDSQHIFERVCDEHEIEHRLIPGTEHLASCHPPVCPLKPSRRAGRAGLHAPGHSSQDDVPSTRPGDLQVEPEDLYGFEGAGASSLDKPQRRTARLATLRVSTIVRWTRWTCNRLAQADPQGPLS